MKLDCVAIIGIGLIGGSLAAAWRQAEFAGLIVGIESDADAAEFALASGLVDKIVSAVPADAQLIAVCTPSDQVAQHVASLQTHTAAIFDVGSVKSPIVASLRAGGGQIPPRFVPCHPIAGSERHGPRAARADLFADATVVITPDANTDPAALDLVRAAWRAVDAEVVALDAQEHDKTLAVTSHLPHLLAFAFMQQVEESQLAYAGGGFRDFTRIAAANPTLWWRILQMNKTEVLQAAAVFRDNLDRLSASIANDDEAAGMAALTAAVAKRQDHNF